jgi:hypothetical protein
MVRIPAINRQRDSITTASRAPGRKKKPGGAGDDGRQEEVHLLPKKDACGYVAASISVSRANLLRPPCLMSIVGPAPPAFSCAVAVQRLLGWPP